MTCAVISVLLAGMMTLLMSVRQMLWKKHPSYPGSVELKFNSTSRTFKILQLTDLHYGENPFTDWGPVQDTNTTRLIKSIIRQESPIDLIVISGDQITANNINGNATAYYEHLCQLVENYTIPYAIIFGNHDDATFETDDSRIDLNTTLRHELMDYIMNRSTPKSYLSLSRAGPTDVFGVSNFVLNVTTADNSSNDNSQDVVLQIMLLDSGGGSINQTIVYNQLQWYLQQRIPRTVGQPPDVNTTATTTNITTTAYVDAIAFQHIPTQQFRYNDNPNQVCVGMNGENGIAPLQYDSTNEIQFLQQYDTSLHFMAVGHNHGNSYCCRTDQSNNTSNAASNINNRTVVGASTLHLCFGRHSGYGGYGLWVRGGRIYEFQLLDDDDDKDATSTTLSSVRMTWKSWVRFEDGTITDIYNPLRQ